MKVSLGFPENKHGIILVVTIASWNGGRSKSPRGVCLDLRSLYFREGLNLHRWLHIFWPFEPGTDMGMAFFLLRCQLCGWLGVWMDLEWFGWRYWRWNNQNLKPKKEVSLFSSSERFTINQYYTLKLMEKRVTPFCSFDSVPDSSSWRYL